MTTTLSAKLGPPGLLPDVVRRTALMEGLDQAMSRRLTTIIAGPGFGKSTTLATWSHRVNCAWYGLDAGDRSLSNLARGLVDAFRIRLPTLPPDLFRGVDDPAPPPGATDQGTAAAVAARLSLVLQDLIEGELALVLDDLQEIGPSGPSASLIESLCRQAPPGLHLILSSRVEAPFPVERLRGQGEVATIDAAAFAFDVPEVASFLAASLGDRSPELPAALFEATGGWPAALRLAVEALRSTPPDDRLGLVSRLRRPGSTLFDYLAQEVFSREPPSVRTLLRYVSLFDRVSAPLCEALGLEETAGTLAGLARRGLFMQPAGEEWFALHALVREFVAAMWPVSDEERDRLLRRAGGWHEQKGNRQEALAMLDAARDYGSVARMLAQVTLVGDRTQELTNRGMLEQIVALGEALPAELRDRRIEQVLGEAKWTKGDIEGALAHFRKLAGGAGELDAGIAARTARLLWHMGQLEEALGVAARARVGAWDTVDEALLFAWTADIHMSLGDTETCRDFATQAVDAAGRANDPFALTTAYVSRAHAEDDSPAAAEDYRKAIEVSDRAGMVWTTAGWQAQRAELLNVHGNFLEAVLEAEAAVAVADVAGTGPTIALGLISRGDAQYHLGRPDQAIADYRAAIATSRPTGSYHTAVALCQLGDVHRERGDLAQARAAYEEAWRLGERSEDALDAWTSLAGLARIEAVERPEEAVRLVDEAVRQPRAARIAPVLLGAGWAALASGDRSRARELAERGAGVARLQGGGPALAESLELKAMASPDPSAETGLLEEAAAIWRDVGDPIALAKVQFALARLSTGAAWRGAAAEAERTLRTYGIRTTAPLAAGLLASIPSGPEAPVRIRTLGGFNVVRDGRPVQLSEWRSKKARDLLKILVARRGRFVPRDVLMEALWPDQNADRLAHRLAVALATVRSVLDPERAHPTGYFVRTEGESYALDTLHLSIDVEEFMAEAAAGLALDRAGRGDEARPALEFAENGYGGDFLEEDAYEDWATNLREEARATYVSVARALASSAAAAGDHDTAIRFRLRLLERDPYDEETHLALVSTLVAAGNHGEARRRYRAYQGRMREIDVEASPFPAPERS